MWTIRRNEKDVVNLYSTLSPLLQVTTGGEMLNFGFWDETTKTPLDAQRDLCKKIGQMAELQTSKLVVDVGSGLAAPALFWKSQYEDLKIVCVNINMLQLKKSKFQSKKKKKKKK